MASIETSKSARPSLAGNGGYTSQRVVDRPAYALNSWSDSYEGPIYETPPAPAADKIDRPHHYARYAIEPITFIMANDLPFCVGNVIKYVLRYDAKNGREDLEKARRYIDMILEDMDRKEKGTRADVVGRPL